MNVSLLTEVTKSVQHRFPVCHCTLLATTLARFNRLLIHNAIGFGRDMVFSDSSVKIRMVGAGDTYI